MEPRLISRSKAEGLLSKHSLRPRVFQSGAHVELRLSTPALLCVAEGCLPSHGHTPLCIQHVALPKSKGAASTSRPPPSHLPGWVCGCLPFLGEAGSPPRYCLATAGVGLGVRPL